MLLGLSGGGLQANDTAPVKMKLEPNVILIGAFYNGDKVSVSGEIPGGAKALLKVSGQQVETALKKKGRALGVLWMNMGTVTFHQIPNVYLVYTGGLNPGSGNGLGIGFDHVKRQLKITPDSEDKDALFDEFLKLKEDEGLYALKENAIRYGAETGLFKSFACTLSLPSRLPQGTYKVDLFAIKDGEIIGTDSQELKVKEIGLPTIISSLAFEHGTLYGVLATLVAIFAGLLMGAPFKGGKGGH
jgi:uncharacterized protein (TIGR02186 family)